MVLNFLNLEVTKGQYKHKVNSFTFSMVFSLWEYFKAGCLGHRAEMRSRH